ncbi:hypothetical protein Y1Q_0003954 [Alligator mississippiensis]|uniref:Uncharacterized protein n=1 Tax=Alligator mississippiensis TaxID=8496 RepID=A0A151PHZ1_ALLMI|nr:hypothetical protein Y1Q_0003954 [Alligator mississippiensis]
MQRGPISGCGREATEVCRTTATGSPPPPAGDAWRCWLQQRQSQDETCLLWWLVVKMEDWVVGQQAWWAEDLTWETTREKAQLWFRICSKESSRGPVWFGLCDTK